MNAYSRDFTPEEIAWLLKDETVHYGTRASEVGPAGSDIQLRALDVPHPELEAALTHVFSNYSVDCAFLVEAERLRNGAVARTLMMVAEAEPSTALTNDVSTVFSDVYDRRLPVDLCFDEGHRDFVATLKRIGARPFYVRRRVALRH